MSYTASSLLAIATNELNYHEKRSNMSLDDKLANAGTNNWTKYARDLFKAGYYNGNKNGCAWCDLFVDWCFLQLTAGDAKKAQELEYQTGPYGASCTWSAKYYRNAGRFSTVPSKGAQIFFGTTGKENHTGLVESFDDIYVYTIEGNQHDKVERCQYARNDKTIVGYGLPNYDAEEVNTDDYVNGIDVSNWNEDLDWQQIKNAGYQFVIIRSSFRNTTDARFIQNISQATALNIPVGVYHFSYALNPEQAKQEAQYVLELIKSYPIQLPIFFDFEYDTIKKAAAAGVTLNKDNFNSHAIAFLSEIERAGYIPGIYYNLDYYRTMVDKDRLPLDKYFIWLAQYANATSISEFDMWQYTSKGRIDGHRNVDFDLNRMKRASWDKLMAQPPKIVKSEEDKKMTQEIFNNLMSTWIDNQGVANEIDAELLQDAYAWARENNYILTDSNKKFITYDEFVTILYYILGRKNETPIINNTTE